MAGGRPTVDLYTEARQQARKRPAKPRGSLVEVQPASAEELVKIMANPQQYPTPVRPVGSGSSVSRCNATASGTLLDMTGLNRILSVKEDRVVVQAGVRLRDLAQYLAADGLELVGGCTDLDRTVGGAVSSGSIGARLPGDGSQLASSVFQLTIINGDGRRVEVNENMPDLLRLMRMSYGLLGVIYSVTLMIRPIRVYRISNTRIDFAEFAELLPNLLEAQAAVRASLFPYKDKVHAELRFPEEGDSKSRALPWKLRDWATRTALPKVVRSVNKAVPMKSLRGTLIDTVTEATHTFSSLANTGSNAAEQTGQFKLSDLHARAAQCTWVFPAGQFASLLPQLRQLYLDQQKSTGFRCDLPAEVWRMNKDQGILLSPSFDGEAFGLTIRSASQDGWEDFLLEVADLACANRGVPLFNLTKAFRPGYAARAYGERLQRFIQMRNRLDPKNRLLNQYFAEHLR